MLHLKTVEPDTFSLLKKHFGNEFIMEDKPPRFGIFCYIYDIKVDIVRHPHSLIRPTKMWMVSECFQLKTSLL